MKSLLNKITNGDCRTLLSKLPDKSIDCVITDPPYGVLKNQYWDEIDIETFTMQWWSLLLPKMKDDSSVFIFWSQKHIQKAIDIFDIDLENGSDRLLIWHHPNLAKLSKRMFLWSYDPLFYKKIGKPHFLADFSKSENSDVMRFSKPQSNYKRDKGIHPTQKPLDLVKNLVSVSTTESSVVLDPFSGSGTTAVACKQLGVDFVAFEQDKGYYKKSLLRLISS